MNAQVVETGTRRVRWGRQFEGTRGSYNVVLRQAAEGVTRALGKGAEPAHVRLLEPEPGLALAEGGHFLDAYRSQGRTGDFDRARSAYERVQRLDPRCAAGAAGLALLERYRHVRTRGPGALREAEAHARRALELDPACAEAWFALAWIEADKGNLGQTLSHSLKAVHLAPDRPFSHMGLGNAVTDPGSASLYLALERRALELDPIHPEGAVFVVEALLVLRRAAEALEVADRALSLTPGEGWLQVKRAQVQFALVAARDRPGASRALARDLVGRYLSPAADVYALSFANHVMVPRLVRLGLVEEALRMLERQLEAGGGSDPDWLLKDPDLQRLRASPRFGKILKGSKDSATMILGCFDQARARGELPAYLEPALAELRTLVEQP